jgi:hypothetical protein
MFKSLKINFCVKTFAVLFCIFGFFGAVSAQMPNISGMDDLQTTVNPAHPRPGEKTTIQVENYSTDLNKAEISWFLGAKLQKQAVGEKSFSFTMGSAGSATTITILAKTSEGQNLQKILTFRPSEIDLVWEAQSYTPPFYKGKALFPYQGLVKVVAIPQMVDSNGANLKPSALTYKWKKDGNIVTVSSGYGKNVFYFNGGVPLRAVTIEVEASSEDNQMFAVNSVDIKPIQPMVRFYENDPKMGILWNNIINSRFVLQNEEVKISAIPYFFDVASKNDSNLRYDWKMNGTAVKNTNGNLSDIIFRQPGNMFGETSVSLQISNSNQDKIFQFGEAGSSITFSGFKAVQGFNNGNN